MPIVSTKDVLWNPADIKVENKGAVVYVESSLTVYNPLFFVLKLWLNKLMRCFYWSVSSKWWECYWTLRKAKTRVLKARTRKELRDQSLFIAWGKGDLGGGITWFLGEQEGGSVVTENPKGGITENFARIQRGDHSISLGKWRHVGRKGGIAKVIKCY